MRIDPPAAVFLIPIGTIGPLCAVYGVAYLERHAHGATGNTHAPYALLLASMALVVSANDLLLLLIAWEMMTLNSCALVVSDHEDAAARAAGRQYLIAGHLATAALLLFIVLLVGTGSFAIGSQPRTVSHNGLLFLLALAGFGTKAGLVPVHVWLPDAHPPLHLMFPRSCQRS
jgi:formate hydrogenlyase subunit 3/multisubunit Na+/H+ antiporter MnhD subunit